MGEINPAGINLPATQPIDITTLMEDALKNGPAEEPAH
jgi:hypothetical protein